MSRYLSSINRNLSSGSCVDKLPTQCSTFQELPAQQEVHFSETFSSGSLRQKRQSVLRNFSSENRSRRRWNAQTILTLLGLLATALVIGVCLYLTVFIKTKRSIPLQLPNYFNKLCNWTYSQVMPSTTPATTNGDIGLWHTDSSNRLYPYNALIFPSTKTGEKSVCLGSIIDYRHILTAASCIADHLRKSLDTDFVSPEVVERISVGAHTSKVAEVIYVHSDYDSNVALADIAIIRVKGELTFSHSILPVCLSSEQDEVPDHCVAFGFTENATGTSTGASAVRIYASSECITPEVREIHRNLLLEKLEEQFPDQLPIENARNVNATLGAYMEAFYADKLCTMGNVSESSCQGTSGGPLMCSPRGIIDNSEFYDPSITNDTDAPLKQFAVAHGSQTDGCNETASVHIFASLKYHRSWIEFVAVPLLDEYVMGSRRLGRREFDECMNCLAWHLMIEDVSRMTRKALKNVVTSWKANICRKLVAYFACSRSYAHLNSTFCDEMSATRFVNYENALQNGVVKIDLVPYFKRERCRQIGICESGSPLGQIRLNPSMLAIPCLIAAVGL